MPDERIELPEAQSIIPDEDIEQHREGFLDFFRFGQFFQSGGSLSPYWSEQRDRDLRQWYVKNSFVSTVTRVAVWRLSTLPFQCLPFDFDDDEAQQQAKITQEIFDTYWPVISDKFLTDLLTQDNGGFIELTGDGDPDGPIQPTSIEGTNLFTFVTGLVHHDAGRCQRTGDNEFPVIVTDLNGKQYKLHRSRVLFFSDAPSPERGLLGVGFCSLSRAIDAVQNTQDTTDIENESLTGNVHGILYGKNWPNPRRGDDEEGELQRAFNAAYMRNAENGSEAWQKPVALFPRGENIDDLKFLALKRYPEGYNKAENYQIAMQLMATAYGLDVRDIWTATQIGATKADAETSHLKAKGKILAWFSQVFARHLNEYVAPSNCYFEADYVDDEQDLQSAEITAKRISYLVEALNSGLLSREVAQQLLVEYEIINDNQYELLQTEPEQQETQDPTEAKSVAGDNFSDELDELARQAASGEISQDEFERELEVLVSAWALIAWREGAEADELTPEQQAELDEEIAIMLAAIPNMSNDFYTGVVGLTGLALIDALQGFIDNRFGLWTNNIELINQIGLLNNPNAEFREWVFNPAKDHCDDCRRLNGQVHTAQEWLNSGFRPRSRSLKCKGFRCGCVTVPASGPSRGSF